MLISFIYFIKAIDLSQSTFLIFWLLNDKAKHSRTIPSQIDFNGQSRTPVPTNHPHYIKEGVEIN